MTPDPYPMIRWDRRKLKRLKREVASAEADVINFDGHELLVPYAKYLIEFLDEIFADGKKRA